MRNNKSNRIGILTFHNASNYGAFLQCQATFQAISEISENVEVIDYSNPFRDKLYSPIGRIFDSKNLLQLLVGFLSIPSVIHRNRLFKNYRKKYLKVSDFKCSPENIIYKSKNYDILVAGSDQIWNPKNNGSDDNYLLSFADKNQKKVSFSSSLTSERLTDKMFNRYCELFSEFDFLSVREIDNFNMFSKQKLKITETLDPVLLYGTEYWDNFEANIKFRNKFDLLYVNDSKYFRELSRSPKNIISIGSFKIKDLFDFNRKLKNHYGPGEFISLIKNAETVYTTSYHAVILCLIYNKPFCVHLTGNKGRDSRILNLLHKFKLVEETVTTNYQENLLSKCKIDFNFFNEEIEIYRSASKNYLRKALSND